MFPLSSLPLKLGKCLILLRPMSLGMRLFGSSREFPSTLS
ncbi:unnamed protein product [Brassica rapa subsp. trilocularis]